MREWIGFSGSEEGPVAGSCEHHKERTGFAKSGHTKRLSAFQGLPSVELVIKSTI
jgi:hypothetical protein